MFSYATLTGSTLNLAIQKLSYFFVLSFGLIEVINHPLRHKALAGFYSHIEVGDADEVKVSGIFVAFIVIRTPGVATMVTTAQKRIFFVSVIFVAFV